jgi:hypothetical protein
MVSSDMASSSREAAMDDACREPAEQEGMGLSGRVRMPCAVGPAAFSAQLRTDRQGNPGQDSRPSSQKAAHNLVGRTHHLLSPTAGKRGF